MKQLWEKTCFGDFRKGTFCNGGQNLYVSAAGVLQRIYDFDVTGSGYPAIPLANSHGMDERPAVAVLADPLSREEYELPGSGSYDAAAGDLNGDGYDDLVIACQNNGTHSDGVSVLYYGSRQGLTPNYRAELPTPDAVGVAIGRFDGGKPALCFLSGSSLRLFFQDTGGFNACRFRELAVSGIGICAGDLDGDGFDDVCVKRADGSVAVYWGGPDGLSAQRVCAFAQTDEKITAAFGSTAARRLTYNGWRPALVRLGGEALVFCGGDAARFYSFRGRCAAEEFSLPLPGARYAVSGNFTGGGDELAVICSAGQDAETDSFLFPRGVRSPKDAIPFRTRGAVTAEVVPVGAADCIAVAQTGTSVLHTAESQLLRFSGGKPEKLRSFVSKETMRMTAAKFDGVHTGLALIHHEAGRVKGDELVRLYLGGPEGYGEENVLDLPGFSAVDIHLADLNDDGRPDVLVTNCAENCPAEDPGSFIYYNGGTGISAERRTILPTIRAHGMAIGDFRRSGWLDIACAGILDREIRIFRGGPDGYSESRMDTVVLGPDPEGYTPVRGNVFGENIAMTPERLKEEQKYGDLRWLFTADFNGDGWLDLFVGAPLTDSATILWGGPEGFSAERAQVLDCPGGICATAADLNKDGWLDLVVGQHLISSKASHYESYVTVYWGGPEGYLESRKTELPAHCANSVAVGDFGGTGWLDIFETAYNNGRERDLPSWVFRNDHGVFDLRNSYPIFNHSGSGCVAGDFNGDGYTDVAVAFHKTFGNHTGSSAIFWGGPGGLSDARKQELPGVGPHGMSTISPGNVMDRGPREYYLSEPRRLPEGASSLRLRWEGECLGTGWVEAQWRCAGSEGALRDAAWSPVLENGAGFAPSGAFAQYRLALCAKCAAGNVRITGVHVEIA